MLELKDKLLTRARLHFTLGRFVQLRAMPVLEGCELLYLEDEDQ